MQEYFPPTLNSLSVALCHLSPTSIILPHPRLSTCPYQKGGTLLVNLRFSPGSSVAGGASIIQLGWTIAARLAPQLPCSRQIRQRTKLFMMEEWKDGNRWNHRAPVSDLTNERVIFTNECWLFRSGVSTFLKSKSGNVLQQLSELEMDTVPKTPLWTLWNYQDFCSDYS